MSHIDREVAADILAAMDLGSSVAEQDTLLQTARVETSVFDDLLGDRVDLIPGTKGSGKTALYRIFVDFIADALLRQQKVIIAHGVSGHGDSVFQAFRDEFEALTEDDFVDFWCLYLMSLSYEQFIRNSRYERLLRPHRGQVAAFRGAYRQARIPEFDRTRTLKEILAWGLAVLKSWRPTLKYTPPEDVGQFELDLFGSAREATASPAPSEGTRSMAPHIGKLQGTLVDVLKAADLSLWLMVDRLDELFPRRSELETRALRGLLRTLRLFDSPRLRVKVFLRDDIFDQIASGSAGFTALSHVVARQADRLQWSEDQILALVVRRIFASEELRRVFRVDGNLLHDSLEFQRQVFYHVFPDTVYPGSNQSATLRWIYNHTMDGRGVVTPRDVIDLVTRAGQWQRDVYRSHRQGTTERLITGGAVRYGLEELSRKKRTTLLEAEFPHLWPHIKELVGGGTEYSPKALSRLFGRSYEDTAEHLESIGVIYKSSKAGQLTYRVPFVYRKGLELSQRYVAD